MAVVLTVVVGALVVERRGRDDEVDAAAVHADPGVRPVDAGDGIEVRPWFTPGYGEALSHRVAKFLGRARHRVRIASPVLTSGPILGTLVEVVNERRCDVAGVIDETQVDEVFHQWATNGVSAWKIPLLRAVLTSVPQSSICRRRLSSVSALSSTIRTR